MIFEGSEKKIEVIVDSSVGDLKSKPEEFWKNIVSKCNAEIISSIKNDHVHAYLLSESSLFVWDNCFLMITCGQTSLINSLIEVCDQLGRENIVDVIFQRKNEYFSHMQKSAFYDDVKKVKGLTPSKAWRLGDIDGHHNFIFNYSRDGKWNANDKTFELLMYNLPGEVGEKLRINGMSAKDIRNYLGVESLFKDFVIDDFSFDPYGYSLNAIRGDSYYTIHLSPEENGSYVSLETNDHGLQGSQIIDHFCERLRPKSFDVIKFNWDGDYNQSGIYQLVDSCEQKIENGLMVKFNQFIDTKNINKMSGFLLIDNK